MSDKLPKCTRCWDKGYATVMQGETGHPDFIGDKGYHIPPHIQKVYCTCARGKAMEREAHD